MSLLHAFQVHCAIVYNYLFTYMFPRVSVSSLYLNLPPQDAHVYAQTLDKCHDPLYLILSIQNLCFVKTMLYHIVMILSPI